MKRVFFFYFVLITNHLYSQDIPLNSGSALLGNSGTTSTQLIYWNGTNAYYGRKPSGMIGVDNHFFRTDGQTRLLIDNSGNVGIGTTSPNARLEVNGNVIIQDYIYLYGANNTGVLMNTLSSGSLQLSGGNSTADGANIRLGGSQGNNDLRIRIGTSEKFRIASNGNVGIGSNDPQSKLDVSGNVILRGSTGIGTTNPIAKLDINGDLNVQENVTIQDFVYLYGANSTGVLMNTLNSGGMVLSGGNSTADGANIKLGGSQGNNDLRIRIGTSEKFRITSNGNVGIGTNITGTHRLAVEGSIGARSVKVEASGWSDFVFDKDYKLRTLEEVEKHINKNGHLPEVPSEAEVKKNGLDLGSMDAKLLQKIEELTLYMIDMNKQLKSQSERVEQLEQENSELKEKVNSLENE